MTRETVLMILGALIIISPWSGLPLAWLSWILPILGLCVVAIGFTLRSRERSSLSVPPPAAPVPHIQPPHIHEESRSSHIAFS